MIKLTIETFMNSFYVSIIMLMFAYVVCVVFNFLTLIIKNKEAIKNKKIAKKRQAIAQIAKEKNELRLAHIRRAQGIL